MGVMGTMQRSHAVYVDTRSLEVGELRWTHIELGGN